MASHDDVPALIRLRGVTKRFPGARALEDVDLDITAGACHALVGENGAGKSTLGKVLAGIYAPDAGTVCIGGRRASFRDPADAIAAGVGMVHQELLFCENLSVEENLCLGRLPASACFVSRRRMRARARAALAPMGLAMDPGRTMGELSVSEQQIVQIAAAVSRGARILVFDEPTSSLTGHEVERLFALLARLRRDGVTVVYITHRLDEIFRACDTVTVLRDGRVVDTRPTSRVDRDTLVRLMIGRSLGAYFPLHADRPPGAELLRVENLTVPTRVAGVSFTLRAGEILGIAGLVGAGRTELAEAVFGLRPISGGRVCVHGRSVRMRDARTAMRHGVGLVPEDRKRHGLVLPMRVRENVTLPILSRFSRWGWVARRRERDAVSQFCDRLRVRTPGLEAVTAGLSGGNQQKLVIARWLAAECGILLVDEPTRGVDVGAKAEIHALMDQLAASGAGILLISSDLPELISLSTRILVLREGRLTAELPRGEATQERVMRAMAGVGGGDALGPEP